MEGKRIVRFEVSLSYEEVEELITDLSPYVGGPACRLRYLLESLLEKDAE